MGRDRIMTQKQKPVRDVKQETESLRRTVSIAIIILMVMSLTMCNTRQPETIQQQPEETASAD